MSSPNFLFFYNFFQRLRKEVGIELDHSQYEDFLCCFLIHPQDDKESLFNLCKAFWLTRPVYRQTFEAFFNEEFNKLHLKYLNGFPRGKSSESNALLDNKNDSRGEGTIGKEVGGMPSQYSDNNNSKEEINALQNSTDVSYNKSKSSEEWIEMVLNIRESSTGIGQAEQLPEQTSSKAIAYLFNDSKHLPFNYRKTSQAWRRFKGKSIFKKTDILDVMGTVERFSRENILTEFKYKLRRETMQQLIWLSDHAVDMVPFEAWDNHLSNLMANLTVFKCTNRFYFQCYPTVIENPQREGSDLQIFEDRGHTISQSFKKVLDNCKRDALVVVFSDGGAFRSKNDQNCFASFYKLFELTKDKAKIIWFNPVPDWSGSSAGFLSLLLPMYQVQDASLKRAARGENAR
jgi:uncharacterized protein with von Willebrand factor type A (vWA) domain